MFEPGTAALIVVRDMLTVWAYFRLRRSPSIFQLHLLWAVVSGEIMDSEVMVEPRVIS